MRAEEQGIAIHRLTFEEVENMAKPDNPIFWPSDLYTAVASVVSSYLAGVVVSSSHPQRVEIFRVMAPQFKKVLAKKVFFAVRDNKTVVGVSKPNDVILRPSTLLESVGRVPGKPVRIDVNGSSLEKLTACVQTGVDLRTSRGLKLESTLSSAWALRRSAVQFARSMGSLPALKTQRYKLTNNQQAVFFIRSALHINPS